jgi:hypothetical protein
MTHQADRPETKVKMFSECYLPWLAKTEGDYDTDHLPYNSMGLHRPLTGATLPSMPTARLIDALTHAATQTRRDTKP